MPPSGLATGSRWSTTGGPVVAALALALAFLNTAPLLALLRREFGLTNFQAGALAAATLLSHTALQLPAGPLVDQLGSRRATLVGLGVVAVGVLLSGLAPSFPALLLARLAVGVGTGLAFLAALVLAAEAVPPARAPWQQSLYGAAFQAGTLLTLALTPVLADRVGWRGAFLSEGAAIGLVALAGRRLLPVPRYARPRVPVPWALVFRAPGVYALGLAHVATYGTVTAVSAWAPTWLLDRYPDRDSFRQPGTNPGGHHFYVADKQRSPVEGGNTGRHRGVPEDQFARTLRIAGRMHHPFYHPKLLRGKGTLPGPEQFFDQFHTPGFNSTRVTEKPHRAPPRSALPGSPRSAYQSRGCGQNETPHPDTAP